METFVLQAEQRNAVGRAENKRLRRAGIFAGRSLWWAW